MTISFRKFAVSGSAAVALLGGAAAITAVTADTASAATRQVAEHAVTAPVQMPDGRTIRITGMGGYGHQATPGHVATITTVAYRTDTNPNTTTGVTPDRSYTDFGSPQQQVPAGYNQQITTQSGGAMVGVGIVSILLLSIIVFVKVKHSGLKAADAVLGALLGIALSGTVIGTMGGQLTNSLVGSLGTMLSGLG